MKYTTFLFDWDGTLLDSLPVWHQVFLDVMAKGNVKLTDAQKRKSYNRWDNARDFVDIDDEIWADMMAFSQKITLERMKQIPLIPGAREMLKALHEKDCKTALVTRAFRDVVGNTLEDHNLIGGFDAVIALEDVKEHKPHPEPLLKAMEELGSDPEDTVMIGDGDGDIHAAHNAGVDSILFWRPENKVFYKKEELLETKPTYLVNSWDEFLKLVQ